ncbi:MAG: biopolymer transporter ExbD [Candidatus Eisenbacteria bacterium]
MNFGTERKRSPLVNVTPLIDALFLLLIFFMVSSTFRDLPGIPLDLPSAKTGEANRSSGVEVQVDREGIIRLEGKIVGEGDLEEKLGAALDAAEGRNLTLRADRGVPYGRVVTVMDAARGLSVERLVVATENIPSPPGKTD